MNPRLDAIARGVAEGFLSSVIRRPRPVQITILKNMILEALCESREPNFTHRVENNKLYRNDALQVAKHAGPYLFDMAVIAYGTMEEENDGSSS